MPHAPQKGDNLDRIRVPQAKVAELMLPSIEQQLNDRQKKIMAHLVESGFVTSGWCRKEFGVALLTTQRALNGLLDLGLVEPKGKGRIAWYVLKTAR